ERGGLARLDYTQNVSNKTLVAPYSPRAAAGAPVSAPIAWEELDDPSLRPDGFTIRTVLDRVAEVGDLFSAVLSEGQRLPQLDSAAGRARPRRYRRRRARKLPTPGSAWLAMNAPRTVTRISSA